MNLCWLLLLIISPQGTISDFFDFSSSKKLWFFISGTFTKGIYSECYDLSLFEFLKFEKRFGRVEATSFLFLLLVQTQSQPIETQNQKKKWFPVYFELSTWNRDFFSSFCCKCWRNLKKVSSSSWKLKIHEESLFFWFCVSIGCDWVWTRESNKKEVASRRPNHFPNFKNSKSDRL